MGFKEFFRLSWNKLIVTSLLVLIPILIGLSTPPWARVSLKLELVFESFIRFLFWPFFTLIKVLQQVQFIKTPFLTILFLALLYLINGLYLYILSCLIIFTYRKLKTK